MKRLSYILLCIILVTGSIMLTGCKTEVEKSENEESQPPETYEYALYIEGNEYAVKEELVQEVPWDGEKVTDEPEQFPFPAVRNYEKENLRLSSFLIDDERGTGEQIFSITTTKEGKTPRNIGIGDGLDVLKNSYPELIYHNAANGNGTEMADFTRMYSFVPEDGSNNYINFYLKDKKITMIEIANSLDAPRNWYVAEPILGQDNLFCEILNDKPGKSHIQYFYVKDNGEEDILLDIHNAWAQSVDLDDDGITEIVVQYTKDNRYTNVEIYRMNQEQLEYIDVNKELADTDFDQIYSYYSEGGANEQSHYGYCIEIVYESTDGSKKTAKYVLEKGELKSI